MKGTTPPRDVRGVLRYVVLLIDLKAASLRWLFVRLGGSGPQIVCVVNVEYGV